MYGCESWTVKKADHQRIDAFELWCWRRFLRVPWTARRSNQSILKETSPGCSLEGLMLKLKLQYFGHLMRRADSLEKTLMLGGIGGRRRRTTEDEMAGWLHWLDGHEFGWTPEVGDGQGGLTCCSSWGRKELDMTELLNWTELNTNRKKEVARLITDTVFKVKNVIRGKEGHQTVIRTKIYNKHLMTYKHLITECQTIWGKNW